MEAWMDTQYDVAMGARSLRTVGRHKLLVPEITGITTARLASKPVSLTLDTKSF
jgi:hypothetical protein